MLYRLLCLPTQYLGPQANEVGLGVGSLRHVTSHRSHGAGYMGSSILCSRKSEYFLCS